MKKILIAFLCFVALPAFGQLYMDIDNGRLRSSLSGNGQDITNLDQITFGAGTPTARLHILPNGTPTTAADGIKFGSDLTMYRSAGGTLTIDGNVVVTGLINNSDGSVDTTADFVWTGSHTFSLGATIGGTGLGFSGTAAAATRAALDLVPGTDVQAYNSQLATIAGLSPSSNAFLIGNGTTWTVVSGSAARTALALNDSATPTFAGLTISGSSSFAAGSFTGVLALPNATSAGAGLTLGADVVLYRSAANVLKTDDTLNAALGGIFGDGNDTTAVLGTLVFGPDTTEANWDTNLYRSQANRLKTDDSFEVGGTLILNAALGVGSGGTGLNLSAMPADRYLYSSSTGVFTQGTITSFGRGLLDDADATAGRTSLGLGTAAVKDAPASGNASGGQVVLATDTRLTDSRTPSGSAGGILTGSYPNPTGIAATGVTAGTYGSSSGIPVIQLGADGRVISVTTATPSPGSPTGSASGALTGSYPAPDIAADAVALGSQTAGNYVSTLTAGTGISLVNSGSSAEGATYTVSTTQNLTTAGSPTFANLTVSGTLNFSSLTPDELTLGDGILTGIESVAVVHVDANHTGATDTRSGIDAYDLFRPFSTYTAAESAATAGDTIVLASGTYTSIAPAKSVTIKLEKGAVITALTMSGTHTVSVIGDGEIRNASGYGVSVTNANAGLTLRVPVFGSSGAVLMTAGAASVYSPLSSTTVTTNSVNVGSSATLNLYEGATLMCPSATGTFDAIAGSGAVNVYGVIPAAGNVAGTITLDIIRGAIVTQERIVAGTATFEGATGASTAVKIGTGVSLYNPSSDTLRFPGTLDVDDLDLGTPLPVAEGGTGSSTQAGARAALGVVDVPAVVANNFIAGNSGGTAYESKTIAQVKTMLNVAQVSETASSSSTVSGTATLVSATNTSSSITLTLPDASTAPEGHEIVLRQAGTLTSTNVTTIAAGGSDTLTGSAYAKLLRANDTIIVKRTSSSNWAVVASFNNSDLAESSATTLTIGNNTSLATATNTSSAINFTLPNPANVPDNRMIFIRQTGALSGSGSTSIIAPSSVALNGVTTGTFTMTAQYESVAIKKIDSTNWAVVAQYKPATTSTTSYVVSDLSSTGVIGATSDVVTASRNFGDTYTGTLPSTGSVTTGRSILIKKTGSSIPTLQAASGDSLDGVSTGSYTMDQDQQAVMITKTAANQWSITGIFKEGGVLQAVNGSTTINARTDIVTQANGGNTTLTLPSAANIPVGKRYVIKVTGDVSTNGGTATVAANGSDTLDGVSGGSVGMVNLYDAVTIQKSSSTGWSVVELYTPRKRVVNFGSTNSIPSTSDMVLSSAAGNVQYTLTLPALSSQPIGKRISIKQIGDLDVYNGAYMAIAANGSDNLDNVAGGSVRLQVLNDAYLLEATSGGWVVISRFQQQSGFRFINNGDLSLSYWDPFVVSNPTTAARTMTLPSVSTSGMNKGFRFTITHTGANATYPTIINTTSGNTINDGEYASGAIKLIYPGETITLQGDANGTTWRVISWSRAPQKLVTLTGSVDLSNASVSAVTSWPDVLLYNNGSAATLTLPVASAMPGRQMTIRSINAGSVSLDPNGATLIDGASSKTLTAGNSITIVFDGTNWYTIGGPTTP